MKRIIFALTLLSVIGIADTVFACVPAFTLTSTYTVIQPGRREVNARVGGGGHERARIQVRAYKAPKGAVPYVVGTEVLKTRGVVRTENAAINYIEFEAVGNGSTVIKVPLEDGSVVDQVINVQMLPTPRGC